MDRCAEVPSWWCGVLEGDVLVDQSGEDAAAAVAYGEPIKPQHWLAYLGAAVGHRAAPGCYEGRQRQQFLRS